MEFLQDIWVMIQAYWQFFMNSVEAAGILLSTAFGALPFTMELVKLLPGVVGSSILITVAVKVVELMVQAFAGASRGGG